MTIVTEREEMILKGVQYIDKKYWDIQQTMDAAGENGSWYLDGYGMDLAISKLEFNTLPELLEWVGRNLADPS